MTPPFSWTVFGIWVYKYSRINNVRFLFDKLHSGPCNVVHVQHLSAVIVPPRHVITSYTSGSVRLVIKTTCAYQNTRSRGRRPRQPPLSSDWDQSDSRTHAQTPLTCGSHPSAVLRRFAWSSVSSLVCVYTHECSDAELWCNTITWTKMCFYPLPGLCTGAPLCKIQPMTLIGVDRFDKPFLFITKRTDQAGAQRSLRNPVF